jgi:hypothetical protein
MTKSPKTLFSKLDLYHLADQIVEMYTRMDLIYKFAKMENNKVMMDAYSGIIFELNLLIESYGMKEMTKIN